MKDRFKKKAYALENRSGLAWGLGLLVQAVFFLVSGWLVVFVQMPEKPVSFVPVQKVSRSKLNLKKPQVVLKKDHPRFFEREISFPKSPLPVLDFSVPEGWTEEVALEDVVGEVLIPEEDPASVFGNLQSTGNDLRGTFYDFRRDRKGRRIPMDWNMLRVLLRDFVHDGWKPSALDHYYRSPQVRYTPTCLFPCMESIMARIAFGEFKEGCRADDYCWAMLYRGDLVYPEKITFRFWGMGDSVLTVRVDGKTVLDAPLFSNSGGLDLKWQTHCAKSHCYYLGNGKSVVGDWITLEAGVPKKMEFLFADYGGGAFGAMLLVEVKGEKYPKNRQGAPILPVFKTTPLSEDLKEQAWEYLVKDEADLDSGPVFCDFPIQTKIKREAVKKEDPPPPLFSNCKRAARVWHTANGKILGKACFVMLLGGKVVLRDTKEALQKIPLNLFCAADQEYVELETPPRFNIDFSKQSRRLNVPPSFFPSWEQPKLFEYTFSAKLKQVSANHYSHPLKVELFVIGKEIMGNRYLLLDRQVRSFIPSQQKDRRFRFSGQSVLLRDSTFYKQRRGERYCSFLIVVSDEKGRIIQYATPKKWLFEHLNDLRTFPVGKHMNKQCQRVFPTPPKALRY